MRRRWATGFSPPSILSPECQSPDRGRKTIRSSGRSQRAQRAPLISPPAPPGQLPPSTSSFSQEPRGQAKPLQPLLRGPGAKVGAGGPLGEGCQDAEPLGAVWPRCSPCSARRTHFPRWLGGAGKLVRSAGWRRGIHSTVKDALRSPGHPRQNLQRVLQGVRGEVGGGRPLLSTLQVCAWKVGAPNRGRTFKRCAG